MNLFFQIAKHLREVHVGGNWTCVNLKDELTGVTWQQATTKVHSYNTIATLVHHCNYYVTRVLEVLEGKPLDGKDELSFNHPSIQSEQDWQQLVNKTFSEAEEFARAIEHFPDSKLWEIFVAEKYGSYYRNLHGIIEHLHYHLGQIVLIKKLLKEIQVPANG